jgi:hypothetical protein
MVAYPSLARLARRLVLVPVLIVALWVVLVDATAAPPADRATGGRSTTTVGAA